MSLTNSACMIGVTTTGAGAGAAYAQIIAPSSPNGSVISIASITASLDAATATSIGLIRDATLGTSSTTNAGQPENYETATGFSTAGGLVTAWSAAPTIAGSPIYLSKVTLPATAGSSVTWEWPQESPLLVGSGATTSILLWNFGGAGGSALSLTVRYHVNARICGPRIRYPNVVTQQNP